MYWLKQRFFSAMAFDLLLRLPIRSVRAPISPAKTIEAIRSSTSTKQTSVKFVA